SFERTQRLSGNLLSEPAVKFGVMVRVLLLEPNRLLARQYTQCLESRGHHDLHLADAQAAIIAADKARPDAIVMELLLAGHSGIEFLYELRSYSEWHRIPVIILSRIATEESGMSKHLQMELGISAYLYKPDITLKKLGSILDKALA